MQNKNIGKSIKLKPLRPNVGLAVEFYEPQKRLIEKMYLDVKKELISVFKETKFGYAMDASISSQSRISLNRLSKKWDQKFDRLAKRITKKMIDGNIKNSAISIENSFKNVMEIDTSFSNEILKEVIGASAQEAANLIKLIPSKFINDVQGQVMRSITTGEGLKDLVPFLKEKYQGDIKKARNTALDQTRKAYQSINTSRLKSMGVKKFIWKHSGGGKTPRQNHVRMSGNEYSFDDPPIIGVMYGSEVKGLPADLPNCRCFYIPIIELDLKKDEK